MKLGFPISLLLHAAILAWALITLKSTRDFKKPEIASIQMDIITADEFAEMRKGDEKSKEKEAQAAKDSKAKAEKEPPKPKVAALPPPPPPPPPPADDILKEMAKSEPKPEPPKPPEVKPEPPKPPEPPKAPEAKADDVLAEMAKTEPKLAPPPPPPPPPPKPPPKPAQKPAEKPPVKVAQAPPKAPARQPSTFDAQSISNAIQTAPQDAEQKALINKDPLRRPSPRAVASSDPAATARTAVGARDGTGPRLSKGEAEALTQKLINQINRCWRPPTGVPDAAQLIPVVKFKLARDGSVSGAPQVTNRLASPSFPLAAEAATRAVLQCQPYDMPADKYDGGWGGELTLDFDPRSLLN